MVMAQDIRSLTTLSNEARQAVAAAFDALARWRDATSAANDRYLAEVLDQIGAAYRALGWPDQAAAATKDQLLKASEMQAHMIGQVMDAWGQELKSEHIGSGIPGLSFQPPVSSGPPLSVPVSEMMRFGELALVPFRVWMEAAEAWQRNLTAAMSGAPLPRSPGKTEKTSQTAARPSA